jgi:hypothetical protein
MAQPFQFGSGQRDQRRFGTPMILLSREQRMCRGKQLQRALSASFFVIATKVVDLFLRRRLDDGQWYLAAGNQCLDGADRATILEVGGGVLLRDGLRALDVRMLRLVQEQPLSQGMTVDPFFSASADRWDVDRVEQSWRFAVRDVDDSRALVPETARLRIAARCTMWARCRIRVDPAPRYAPSGGGIWLFATWRSHEIRMPALSTALWRLQ